MIEDVYTCGIGPDQGVIIAYLALFASATLAFLMAGRPHRRGEAMERDDEDRKTKDMFEEQPTYPESPGYVEGSETSVEAAESMEQDAPTLRAMIEALVRAHERMGATCDEIEVQGKLRHQTASARFSELKEMGLLIETKERRKTRSGRGAFVHVTPEFATKEELEAAA